jgi:aromatic ring-cleaving dioxygenase
MPTKDALDVARGSGAITSYHAHVYWRSPEERVVALRAREWLGERFGVALGRIHDQPVGPHTQPMYQVAFTPDVLTRLLPWLLLNRNGLRRARSPEHRAGRVMTTSCLRFGSEHRCLCSVKSYRMSRARTPSVCL